MIRIALRVVIGVALIAALILGGRWTWVHLTADVRGETQQHEQIHADGIYRTAVYESFFDLCAAVQTKEAEIGAAQTELDTTEPSDYRRQQLNTNITALTSARAELINEYNASAAMTDTQANFHSSDLPFELDIDTEETTCAAPSN